MNGSFHGTSTRARAPHRRGPRPDVVHMEEEPYNLATFLAARAAARVTRPCGGVHLAEPRTPAPAPVLHDGARPLARTDHLVCGSRACRSHVWRAVGYRGAVSVLPQVGVDPDMDASDPPRRPTPAPSPSATSADSFPRKGVELLVHAFAAAAARRHAPRPDRRRTDTRAPRPCGALVGRRRPRRRRELDAVERDALERMRELDVLVLPSLTRPNWKEQFGRVLSRRWHRAFPSSDRRQGKFLTSSTTPGSCCPKTTSARSARRCSGWPTTPRCAPTSRPGGPGACAPAVHAGTGRRSDGRRSTARCSRPRDACHDRRPRDPRRWRDGVAMASSSGRARPRATSPSWPPLRPGAADRS